MLQELDVVISFVKHGYYVHLGSIRHQVLQRLQAVVDPFSPLLPNATNTTIKGWSEAHTINRI